MATRIGINGFGRIGRQVVRAAKIQGVADLDVLLQTAQHRIVLEQVRHRFRIAEVVGRDDVEIAMPLQVRPEEVAPNPPKPVDPDSCLRHFGLLALLVGM